MALTFRSKFSRIVPYLGLMGAVFTLFGCLGVLLVAEWNDPLLLIHFGVGIALLVIWFIKLGKGYLDRTSEVLSGRSFRFAVNLILYSVVFFGLIVCANLFARRYRLRWDLSAEHVHSLSSESVRALQGLKNPLTIVSLDLPDSADNSELQDLISRYVEANPEWVRSSIIDPRKYPHLIDELGLEQQHLMYIEYGVEDHKRSTRLSRATEEQITNSIIRLMRGQERIIYHVQGHGEPELSPDDPAGLGKFAAAAGDVNMRLQGIILAQTSTVPRDAAALILVSPSKALLPAERDMIVEYINRGGRVLLLHDPFGSSDIATIAAQFGIVVGENVVLDHMQQLIDAPDAGWQLVIRQYGAHPITWNLDSANPTVFLLASSVTGKKQDLMGMTYADLARTSATSWAETDLASLKKDPPEASLDPERDPVGPHAIVVSYERRLAPANTASDPFEAGGERFARLVVAGDSDWIRNANIDLYSNREFALQSISWLAGDEAGVSIPKRSLRKSQVFLTRGTFLTALAAGLLVPELILLIGLWMWWNRRRVLGEKW